MAFDLLIEAKIYEKNTNRVITKSENIEYILDIEDTGFIEICGWHTRDFYKIRDELIQIINKVENSNYSKLDDVIPLPKVALSKIYSLLLQQSNISDEEFIKIHKLGYTSNIEWWGKSSYERENIENAMKLKNLLHNLELIKFDNKININSKYIPNLNDYKKLIENPQDFEWEFRIINSY